jgi:hypothetical protein
MLSSHVRREPLDSAGELQQPFPQAVIVIALLHGLYLDPHPVGQWGMLLQNNDAILHAP